jgi:hypothetical protein
MLLADKLLPNPPLLLLCSLLLLLLLLPDPRSPRPCRAAPAHARAACALGPRQITPAARTGPPPGPPRVPARSSATGPELPRLHARLRCPLQRLRHARSRAWGRSALGAAASAQARRRGRETGGSPQKKRRRWNGRDAREKKNREEKEK